MVQDQRHRWTTRPHPVRKTERYDYFVIWGNGIAYRDEIIGVIRDSGFLRILKIVDHKPKSISKLVRTIYSYDYAPLEHLKAKTEYLLKTDPGVTFVFVRNKNSLETFRGEGGFRHIECENIKAMKDEIRDKFNPSENGQRTEEHVVHASDSQSQVDYILKYLGFEHGVGYLSNEPNPILSVPYYIPKFREFTVKRIETSQLYCSILRGTRQAFQTEPVPIEKTPHFACLEGNTAAYEEYLNEFGGGPLTWDYSLDGFLRLSKNLGYLEPPHPTSYILVRKLREDEYLILDGVHRASILKSRGVNPIAVAVIE